jgi:cyanamide hydratase
LTCLFHDIGTTQENLHATLLSFEFYGGYLALNQLQDYGAPKEQAESVTEAIIRHQDLGDIGTISTVGQLIQLSTLFGTPNIQLFVYSKSKFIIQRSIVLTIPQTTPATTQPS